MKKEELVWETWYAWHPVLLEDTNEWVWFKEVERAFDPTFIETAVNFYVPYTGVGMHYYRSLTKV